MINKWSMTSRSRLETCHYDLQTLFNAVLPDFDCTVLCGHRTEEEQNKAFAEGKSQLKWPNSKHNGEPSLAIDVAPWPIKWEEKEQFYYFGGFVMGVANELYNKGLMTYRIRYGGDWDGDKDLRDQSLFDLVHFEIILK